MNTAVLSSVPSESLDLESIALSGIHWNAFLELQFQDRPSGCRLVRNRHQGPLYVQKPFYPEGKDLPHVYLLHPPGGLVSGDELKISIDMQEGSKALVTTPGAGRVYRARKDQRLQQQNNFLKLGPEASLEWFPQETIVFSGAHTRLNTHVELSANSLFMGWEITSLGLPACGLGFDEGKLNQRLMITCDKRPLLIENLVINPTTKGIFNAVVGMQGNPVNGIFIAGPLAKNIDSVSLLAVIRQLPISDSRPYLNGISVVGDFIVARYLGGCTEQAKDYFIKVWEILRPCILARKKCEPRIWAT